MAENLPLAHELAAVYARGSGLLLSREKVEAALALLTSLATETFPGSSGAGITLRDEHGQRATAAATDPIVEQADELQYELGCGPCLTAWAERRIVRVNDASQDHRWPAWSEAVTKLELSSSLSVPVVAGAASLGALKVYGQQPTRYSGRDARLLGMFAALAATLLANLRTTQNAGRLGGELREAMRGRDVVSMAKGILMAREGVDERTAFLTMADLARQQARPVREVAERLTQSTVRRRR